MSWFEKLKIVSRYELLKHFRRKRFYGALGVTILAVLLMIGFYKGLDLPGQMGLSDSPELFAIFVTSMSSLAIIGAVFFSGDSIASEFERKTGYILFPNPVNRANLVAGKYIACVVATAVILIIAFLISSISLLVFYGTVPIGVLKSLAMVLMLGCSVVSISFAFSSVLKGGMGATIATLLTFMVIFPTISTSLSYAGYSPWYMPDRAADAMASTYDISMEEAFGGMMGGGAMMGGMMRASQDPTRSFFVLLTYAVVLFLASVWITKDREMT